MGGPGGKGVESATNLREAGKVERERRPDGAATVEATSTRPAAGISKAPITEKEAKGAGSMAAGHPPTAPGAHGSRLLEFPQLLSIAGHNRT